MKLSLFVLAFLYFTLEVNAWLIFNNGRRVGGNAGEPKTDKRRGSEKKIPDEWFTQELDHFSPTDKRTWQQRFHTNDQFFNAEAGGPVFLMIGGESTASVGWMTQGSWVEYAEKFGALLFQVEHRYYGKSHPTEDLSTEHLKYLTSQQALADLATFITAQNKKYNFPSNVKWIVFGGSYPGSLAAWLRLKYPHLVHGAVSSSAPILAKFDFQDAFRVVSESLATHSEDCVTAIRQGIDQIGTLLKQEIGQKNLSQIFKLCDPIQSSISSALDISNFYKTIAFSFAGVVQDNEDPRAYIDVVCDIMVNQTIGPPVNRLGTVNELILKTYSNEKCLNYQYEKIIDTLRNVSWESRENTTAEGMRQWLYQTCTEFGFYQTSTYEPHIFGNQFPIDFFVKQCADLFGDSYSTDFIDGAVNHTNTLYGGLDIKVSNVVFVHGSIDPWHALGLIKTVDPASPVIYIEGTSHCADMNPSSETDLPQLKIARQQIRELIATWLKP